MGVQGSVAPSGQQRGEEVVSKVGWALDDVHSFAAALGMVDFFQ